MLFPTTELAARIESAERDLIAAFAQTAIERANHPGAFIEPLAGGVATWTSPDSPINKVAGLGFDGVPTENQLADTEQRFAAVGSPVVAEVSTLADPGVAVAFTRRGYILVGHENVFAQQLADRAPTEPDPSLTIEICTEHTIEPWINTVVDGFLTPDTQGVQPHEQFDRQPLCDVMQDTANTEGFVCFLASRDGQPAAGASVRISGTTAQLCGCAVLPAFRRRGIQTSLLAERLSIALARGCDLAVMTTQPGSKSHHNAQRQGFQLLYSRCVLIRDPNP